MFAVYDLIWKYITSYLKFQASAGLTCITDEKKCTEEECCIKITNLMGRCAKLKKEGRNASIIYFKRLKKLIYVTSKWGMV